MNTCPRCPCCGGRGVIPKRDPKPYRFDDDLLDDCKVCNGSGLVSFERYKKYFADCPTDYIDDENGKRGE